MIISENRSDEITWKELVQLVSEIEGSDDMWISSIRIKASGNNPLIIDVDSDGLTIGD